MVLSDPPLRKEQLAVFDQALTMAKVT